MNKAALELLKIKLNPKHRTKNIYISQDHLAEYFEEVFNLLIAVKYGTMGMQRFTDNEKEYLFSNKVRVNHMLKVLQEYAKNAQLMSLSNYIQEIKNEERKIL
jgi:hypothetical protein